MAVIKAVSSKAGIGQALDYVTKEEKTEDKLVSGLHCEPDTVKDEMQATKELCADTMSLAVFLISLAVSVYFAEPIRAVIPINLLLLLILVHIVYVLIRWYVKGCMRSRGYY